MCKVRHYSRCLISYCKLKWKLSTSRSFWYNGFTTKHKYSQKKGKVLWCNHITLGARNATTIIHFIVTAKIQTATKSISAETAVINLHPNDRGSEGAICRRKHPPCPVCGKAFFLHHDYEHYSNYRCTDKSATIPFLYGSPLPLLLRLCQPFSVSTISSVCVIPFKLSARLCQYFISARIHFGISVSYLKLHLILRPLIPLSAIGALNSPRCLTICGFSLFPY